MRVDCWAKGGGKEGQGLKNKNQDSAMSAEQKEQQPDLEAWAAIEDAPEESNQCSLLSKSRTESELYDSGASCHMSPFCQQFVSYRLIPPRPIMAVDKWVFYANGIGDLRI